MTSIKLSRCAIGNELVNVSGRDMRLPAKKLSSKDKNTHTSDEAVFTQRKNEMVESLRKSGISTNNSRFLTVKDIREYLAISKDKSYDIVRNEMNHNMIGNQYRISIEDFAVWLINNKVIHSA